MEKVQEYRNEAQQCIAQVAKTKNPSARARFLQLAMQWNALADEREKFLQANNRPPEQH